MNVMVYSFFHGLGQPEIGVCAVQYPILPGTNHSMPLAIAAKWFHEIAQ
jgi:hypothetical protein